MSDGQPLVESPKIKARITMKINASRAIANEKKPTKDAMANGVSEKVTIPSNEYLKSPQNDQLV